MIWLGWSVEGSNSCKQTVPAVSGRGGRDKALLFWRTQFYLTSMRLKIYFWESPWENCKSIMLHKPTQKGQWWREKKASKPDIKINHFLENIYIGTFAFAHFRHQNERGNIFTYYLMQIREALGYTVHRMLHRRACKRLSLSGRQTQGRKRQGQSDLFGYCGDETSFHFWLAWQWRFFTIRFH